MCPLDRPPAVVRTDPAPGFKVLTEDQQLKHHRITLDLGHPKNRNKNPVAERAVQEFENELLRHDPLGGPMSLLTLAVNLNLNARTRSHGLSSREMCTQRDQFSNHQIPLHDQSVIVKQHKQRVTNHTHSKKAKAPISRQHPANNITVGDLVYLFSDRNKTRAGDRYLITAVSGSFCNIRKFVGSQLRSTSYHVKTTDCYRVPSEVTGFQSAANSDTDEALSVQPEPSPPAPPVMPSGISTPAIQEVPDVNLPADEDKTLILIQV